MPAPLDAPLQYALCPRCQRAVPRVSGEQFCSNDGTRLMTACPHCQAAITSPYARHCTRCGQPLTPKKEETK